MAIAALQHSTIWGETAPHEVAAKINEGYVYAGEVYSETVTQPLELVRHVTYRVTPIGFEGTPAAY